MIANFVRLTRSETLGFLAPQLFLKFPYSAMNILLGNTPFRGIWPIVALLVSLLTSGIWTEDAFGQPAAPLVEPAANTRATQLTSDLLEEAIELARQHLLAMQTEHGDFIYEFDFTTDQPLELNHPARQASGVWGLALLHLEQPSEETRAAVLAGIRFFQENSLPQENGSCVLYPVTLSGHTNTQAIICLAEIDFLRVESTGETAEEVRGYLDQHLKFLASLQTADGRFHSQYNYVTGEGFGDFSPFADGEALLALAKAAIYLDRQDYVPDIMRGAESMWQAYFVQSLALDDETTPLEFYQWGSLSFYEISRAGMPGSEPFAARTIEMGHWVIPVLTEISRESNVNMAAVYEGLNPAWAFAELQGDEASQAIFREQIEQGILKSLAYQVGNSQASDFLREHGPIAERAVGGCQWYADDTTLRIDGVFHQLHALLQTRKFQQLESSEQLIHKLAENDDAPVEQSAPAQDTPAATAEPQHELTRELLDESLNLARQHMLAVQSERGDFYYEFDYITGDMPDRNNQVRQAGGLWGLALLHHAEPNEETRQAVLRGIRFWQQHSLPADAGGRFVAYPGDTTGKTGTQALVALAEIEFLRVEPAGETYDEVAEYLEAHLEYLLTLQFEDGRFRGKYNILTGEGEGLWSPFSDGESLLALAKAAAYLGREDLLPAIMLGGEGMWNSYVVLPEEVDDKRTRTQFYQWGSMSFYEIYKAGWEGSQPYAGRVIEMAHWRVAGLASRPSPPTANFSYAYEGLCSAWEAARLSDDVESQEIIGRQIRQGVLELMGFQVGNPLANEFIQANPPGSDISLGGCLSRPENPNLRIDNVQHQAHALLLTRRYLFDGP